MINKTRKNVRYLDAKRGEFEDALNGEEEGEEIVEVDEDVHEVQGRPLELEHEQEGVEDDELGWKFMSCSHVKSWVNLMTWLLIGCSLLCSQSGANLLVDTTLDNDSNS